MKKLIFLLLGIVLIGQGCLEESDCNECYSGPFPWGFTILPDQEGKSLIPDTYKPDTIKLYYIEGDQKKNIRLSYGMSIYLDTYVVSTDISVVSAGSNVKTFYLYLNHDDTDTIYFDCKIANDGCCTYYSLDSLSYNGKTMPRHTASRLWYAIKPQPTK